MAAKRKSKGAYMISAVAEMYEIHPQTLRLYEREGLLKPSRTEGNTRLYTDEDLERLEFILNLARDLGVNIAGHRHHPADARADGRDEPADAELCGVRADGDADALPAECAGAAGAIVPIRRPVGGERIWIRAKAVGIDLGGLRVLFEALCAEVCAYRTTHFWSPELPAS
jgi:MerR family transcriptional regulator/heat shock protein HspR